LKTPGAFQAADYFSLQGKARETLGADLLDVQRLTLMPGQQLELARSGHVEARALGIVAGYRDLDASAWRLMLDLPKSRSTNIYKFWQFSPGGAEIELGVNQKGVTIISYENSGKRVACAHFQSTQATSIHDGTEESGLVQEHVAAPSSLPGAEELA